MSEHHTPSASASAEALAASLRALGYGRVTTVERTGSTNTDLVEAAQRTPASELPDLSVLLAEEQSAGRGRLGRRWTAPAGTQIIASILLRLPEVPAHAIGLLPLLTGLSIAEGVRNATGLPAELKWPNDVLIDGRKLAGILVEAVTLSPHPVIVVGFGVNVSLRREDLPVAHATSIALELDAAATTSATAPGTSATAPGSSLADAGSAPDTSVDRAGLTLAILQAFEENLRRFRNLGGSAATVLPRYRALCATLGAPVSALLPGDRRITGTATAVTDAGELLLTDADGRRHTVAAGDVVHLRPQDPADPTTASWLSATGAASASDTTDTATNTADTDTADTDTADANTTTDTAGEGR